MALEFTEEGKNTLLQCIFSSETADVGPLTNVAGLNNITAPPNGPTNIYFFGGTRPNIATVSRTVKTYAGATRVYPQASDAIISTLMVADQAETNFQIDWLNNRITFNRSDSQSFVPQALFGAGNIDWFAWYGYNSTNIALNSLPLFFTGTVGLFGSGADIELNRVAIPEANYPVEVKRVSFSYPQPTNLGAGVDVVFNKHIYTTAITNMFGARGDTANRALYLMKQSRVANTKYFSNGTNRIEFFSGTRPNTPEDAVPAGNVLVAAINTFAMHNLIFSTRTKTVSETSLALTGNWSGTALQTQNPNWCRIYSNNLNNATTYVSADCYCGLPGSGRAIIYNDPVVSGAQINIKSVKFRI